MFLKNIKKIIYFFILFLVIDLILLPTFFAQKNQESKEEKKTFEKEKLFCNLDDFYFKKELGLIKKKQEERERQKRLLAEKIKQASLSENKVLIISTASRGKSGFGNYYAFGDNFMFKKGLISSGRKNYETPIGNFDLKYKKKFAMSNLYPDPNGINNMDDQIGITNYGIALHKGSPKQLSHGCVHIDPKDSSWLFN
jgi:hypothetical protein